MSDNEDNNDPIYSKMGLRALPQEQRVQTLVPQDYSQTDQVIDDVDTARGNLLSIIETGSEALDDLVALSKASQSPRAYEVAAKMMDTLRQVNKDFVDLAQVKRDMILGTDDETAEGGVTNNNVFLGTSTDFLRMARQALDAEKDNNKESD